MQNRRTRNTISRVIIWMIILISFCNLSAWFYPMLNTDMGTGILMSKSYNFPGDLYLWGQSHNGSFISALANLLVLTYFFPAALAWSVAQFAVLIIGFFSISSLFRSTSSKVLLALVWFLPSWHFHDLVISGTGTAVSLLCTGIYLLNRSLDSSKTINRVILLSSACALFILSVWTSDIMFIPLLIILCIAVWRWSTVIRKSHFAEVLRTKEIRRRIIITFLMTVVGIGFIYYAKSRAFRVEGIDLNLFNFSALGISWSIQTIFSGIADVFLFRAGNLFESLQAWLVLTGIPVLLYLSYTRRKLKPFFRKHKWLLFFTVSFAGSLVLMTLFMQPFSFRPMIYISLWISLLLFMEASCSAKRSLRIIFLFVMIIPGALSSFVPFWLPQRIPPARKVASEFSELGKAGLITSAAEAFLIPVADPRNIFTAPHDSAINRNPGLVVDVFRQPALYAVRDGWMDQFPDTLKQYGQILLKRGSEFSLGGRSVCRYEKYIYTIAYTPEQMKFQGVIEKDSVAWSKEVVRIDSAFDRSKHFIFGPYIPLQQGRMKVEYRLKAGNNLSTNPAAVLEVSADYGKKLLGSRTIRWSDFQKMNHYETFDMIVDIPQFYNGVEFRIMFLGGHQLWFDQVQTTGM